MSYRSVALVIALSLLAACGKKIPEAPAAEDVDVARAAANELGASLKAQLVSALGEGGPKAGIAVCKEAAPNLAAQVSNARGVDVGRTALRVRNPSNAPDGWEQLQLECFARAIKDGADPASLEVSEVVVENGARHLRWMKPIVMDGPCALCHGEVLSEDVKSALLEAYPEDQATGFLFGELRGAFTVTKELAQEE